MKKSIQINAPLEAVWNAIVSYRESQPHRRRVLSKEGCTFLVEESFTGLPMVGSSRIVYEEVELPVTRIDFKLVEGEHLSQFSGSWQLVAIDNGQSCEAYLEADFDMDLPIPFKENILNQLAEMDMTKRLSYVKDKAETPSI